MGECSALQTCIYVISFSIHNLGSHERNKDRFFDVEVVTVICLGVMSHVNEI